MVGGGIDEGHEADLADLRQTSEFGRVDEVPDAIDSINGDSDFLAEAKFTARPFTGQPVLSLLILIYIVDKGRNMNQAFDEEFIQLDVQTIFLHPGYDAVKLIAGAISPASEARSASSPMGRLLTISRRAARSLLKSFSTRTLLEKGLNPASYFSLNFYDPINKLLPKYEAKKVFIEGDALILALSKAKKPVIISGSGVIWSRAWAEMQEFVEKTGIPFYTTPQGRGVVPDDHPYAYLAMRSTAFREADLILIVGTRMNYIITHAAAPRFNANATIARIDIDADELASAPRKIDIPIVGDCKMVLQQIVAALDGGATPERLQSWRRKLADGEAAKRAAPGANKPPDGEPIHPVRLCEEIAGFMQRDAILVVDGQEILNYGRQSMPTFTPGHRLNSGPFGTMGVGLPFGLGAKIAKPDKQVIVVHGDGSFGMNAMELDTAVRHKIPVLVVISLNGGWTADPKGEKPGRNLGYTRYDKMAETLGCHGEYVVRPDDIRPALERAQRHVDDGRVAVVNVVTDYRARAGTLAFSVYQT
jgi:TPP-dependent trihydroxycyclohexane-1,2-dione (THcHDO) dehydratase